MNTEKLTAIAVLSMGMVAGCVGPDSEPRPEASTSLYTLVTAIDGTSFLPPLGSGATVSGPFDPSLLDQLEVALEASAGGATRTIATFDRHSSPALRLMPSFEVYFVDVPAAPWFTDPSSAYHFRVLLSGHEIARSDLSGRIFEILRKNPAVTVGVKVRIEARPVPSIASISPPNADRGSPGLSLVIAGEGFASDSIVRFDGLDLATTRVSSERLTAAVPARLLTSGGTHELVVFTPRPGGGASAARTFRVRAGSSGAAIVAAGATMSSPRFSAVVTLGESPAAGARSSSRRYALHSGVVAATR